MDKTDDIATYRESLEGEIVEIRSSDEFATKDFAEKHKGETVKARDSYANKEWLTGIVIGYRSWGIVIDTKHNEGEIKGWPAYFNWLIPYNKEGLVFCDEWELIGE